MLAREVAARVASALQNSRFYDMAREAIRARDEFVLLASHELRTPLSSLLLLVDHRMRRKRQGQEDEGPQRDEAIARQVRRLTGLVERMLDAVRVQAEGISLTPEPCDLGTLLETAVKGVTERTRRPAGARIGLHSDSAVVGMWDRARMAKAVDELLDNAVKFGAGKPIEVELRQEGSDAVLTVQDHGVGIPADRLASIFSPFERAASKEHYGGLGLGLFVTKAIIEAHGGSLNVTSRQGDGATFVVRAPLGMGPT